MVQTTSNKLVLIIILVIGILLVTGGAYLQRNRAMTIQSYVETEGTFIDTVPYDEDTSSLVYSYVVNGIEYKISTDYGTDNIPSVGTTKTIYYNPTNPNIAIIQGISAGVVLLIIGSIFIVVSGIIFFYSSKQGKEKMKIQGIVVGTLFIAGSSGIYFLVGLELGTFNIIEIIWRQFFVVLILTVLFGVGVWTVFANVFAKSISKEIELKITKISNVDGKYVIRFEDRSVLGTNLFQMAGKFFVYSTSSSWFREGEIYRTDLYKHGVMFNAIQIDNTTARTLEHFDDSDFIRIGYEEPPIKIEAVKPTLEEMLATGKTDAELIMERDFNESIISTPFNQIDTNMAPLVEKLRKTQIIVFFVFWFGFLVVFCATAFASGAYDMIIVSSLFWIFGIWQLIAHLKKPK